MSAEAIDAVFDVAATEGLPAIAIFPAIRTEAQLVDQLQLLASGDRWQMNREIVEGLVTDDVLLGLRWKTPRGITSLPMGFAPFGTMPVTRRAPYVCIATWTGAHENPHHKRFVPDIVDFLDSRLPEALTGADYKVLWSTSVDRTGDLLSETNDNSKHYRRVAFRLSSGIAHRF